MISLPLVEDLWFRVKLFLVRAAYYRKRGRALRYGLPAFLVLLDILLLKNLPSSFFEVIHPDALSFILLIFIATMSAWFGGLGPGLLATILSALVNYSLLLKIDIESHAIFGDQLTTVIYLILGFMISLISEARYESEAQKDEFIGLAAHELKNPLSSIKGFAELLSYQAKKAHLKKMEDYANIIHNQSYKLQELINDLLDVTKIDIGKFVYKTEPFVFQSLVEEIIANQQVINKARNLRLVSKSKKVILGDRYRIGQVLTNLLSNAFKYSPDRSPVKVTVKDKPKGILLSVEDHGIGIPPSVQRRIFSQFYRAKKTEKGKAEGLGLGLFISSQIVKQCYGKLWVKSKEGEGSIFFLELPNK